MELTALDWLVVLASFVASSVVGLLFTRRAGKSVAEYFTAGRSLPWWLSGTSMVATTFAADTPLVVTALVAQHGLPQQLPVAHRPSRVRPVGRRRRRAADAGEHGDHHGGLAHGDVPHAA